MNKLGIRGKIILIFTSVTLSGGLLLFLSAGLQLQSATLEFYQHNLQMAAFNMASRLSDSMESDDEEVTGSKSLQSLLERNPSDSKFMFTVFDAQGLVQANTYIPRYALNEALPKTSELSAALAGRPAHVIRTSETGEKRAYAAVPILYEGKVLGAVRVAAPMDEAYQQARQKWYELAAIALPILLLTIGAGLWLGRMLTRPIKLLSTSALRIADGAFDERVEVKTRDEIGQLAQTFNFMAGRINGLMATQRSFVSNAAHELRAPLMSLKLRCEALQDQTLSDEQKTIYLAELSTEVNRMSTLISQLLILARLDEGRHQVDQPPEDTVAFLQDMARTWRIRATTAELRFEANIPATLPDLPVAASDLQIMVDNLLSNAVKYTPAQGQVFLRASSDGTAFRLAVRDTGEGFSPEEHTGLFERFTRLAHVREKDIPGTGLGLAIVKAVLERYGGTITATSDGPNRGATFEINFPLAIKAG